MLNYQTSETGGSSQFLAGKKSQLYTQSLVTVEIPSFVGVKSSRPMAKLLRQPTPQAGARGCNEAFIAYSVL